MVYGNRYRSEYVEVENSLNVSEKLFFKGDYRASLENILKVLSEIEPDITKRIAMSIKK